jgi:hypothetical protein
MRSLFVSLSLLAMIASNGSDPVDTVRLGLESSSATWFSIVKYSGYAVAVGCALEAPETFQILKRWWLLKFRNEHRHENIDEKRSWLIPAAAAGLLAIVLGIFLETYAEGKVSDIDAQIRAHESDKITEAEGSAAAAIRDAGTAKDSAVQAKASAAQVAATSLELARVLDAESPRGLIISRNGNAVARALTPFRGQRFTIHICGADSINGKEETGTVESLRRLLGNEALWKEVSGNNNDSTCVEAHEARVYVNSKAGLKTVAAARALSHQMSDTLPSQRGAWFFVLSPRTLKSGPSPMYPTEKELSWMVANDPNLIGILIGPRPEPMNKNDIQRTSKVKLSLK